MGCSGIFHHSSGFEGSFSKVDPLISFSFFGILWDSLGFFGIIQGSFGIVKGFFRILSSHFGDS